MSDFIAFLETMKKQADDCGVAFYPPTQPSEIRDWKQTVIDELKMDIPDEISIFLTFTNGLHTDRGYLFDADSFLEQNACVWLDESHVEKAEYAWLGTYGSMDMYIFDFESRQYRATSLGFPDEIYFSAPTFEELLSYITRPRE
jgi:hypothetical protein